MGIDFHGFVEVRLWPQSPEKADEVPWEPAVPLDLLYVKRDDDAFGCLFGVMNDAGFRPVAEGRGLPTDASPTVRAEFESALATGDRDAGGPPGCPGRRCPRSTGTSLPRERTHGCTGTGGTRRIGGCRWAPVWGVMELLAGLHDGYCRLVVWFDG